jgi:predicted alpha/beta superfamily hydrolase
MKHDQQGQQRRPGSTTTIDFTARGNARTYRLIVTVPHAPPPPQGYPVLVVLDGNVCQPIFAAAVTCLALGGEIDPPLVVGIGYPEQEIEVWQGAGWTSHLAPRSWICCRRARQVGTGG